MSKFPQNCKLRVDDSDLAWDLHCPHFALPGITAPQEKMTRYDSRGSVLADIECIVEIRHPAVAAAGIKAPPAPYSHHLLPTTTTRGLHHPSTTTIRSHRAIVVGRAWTRRLKILLLAPRALIRESIVREPVPCPRRPGTGFGRLVGIPPGGHRLSDHSSLGWACNPSCSLAAGPGLATLESTKRTRILLYLYSLIFFPHRLVFKLNCVASRLPLNQSINLDRSPTLSATVTSLQLPFPPEATHTTILPLEQPLALRELVGMLDRRKRDLHAFFSWKTFNLLKSSLVLRCPCSLILQSPVTTDSRQDDFVNIKEAKDVAVGTPRRMQLLSGVYVERRWLSRRTATLANSKSGQVLARPAMRYGSTRPAGSAYDNVRPRALLGGEDVGPPADEMKK
ncbi:hypothetical protein DFH09DRAFT_1281071 [Mycena vulgaris]|nr:hypothetical protein DFH09DRAFT_1281071 [Mycena vulgaris]